MGRGDAVAVPAIFHQVSIPHFSTETEELAFWENHDSADCLEWGNASKTGLPHHKPSPQTLPLSQPLHKPEDIRP